MNIITAIEVLAVKSIVAVAAYFAHTATFGTFGWIFEEPKMPESLIKKQLKH